MLQEGYNADLLRTQPAPASDFQNGAAAKEEGFVSRQPHVPFWRTTKGIVIIVVAVLVILAAVIGGAVGGTAGKHKNNATSPNSPLGGQGGQGVSGPAQPSTTTNTTGPLTQNSAGDSGPFQNVSVVPCDPSKEPC